MTDSGLLDYEAIVAAVRAEGLAPRGAFNPEPGDGVPDLDGGRPVRTLVLAGNAGPGMWSAFSASPEHRAGGPHPLDAWSRRVVGGLAARLGAQALHPFDGPPYLPFLRWAQRADAVWPSVLGPLIHAEYGLWHAYRGALAFARPIDVPARPSAARPCDACVERPCLHACPVGAFAADGYDVPACSGHLAEPAGTECMAGGCLARGACPVGRAHRYAPAQSAFHMRAFLRARLADAS